MQFSSLPTNPPKEKIKESNGVCCPSKRLLSVTKIKPFESDVVQSHIKMGILHGSAHAELRVIYWKTGGLPQRDSPVARMAHISIRWLPGRTCSLEIS